MRRQFAAKPITGVENLQALVTIQAEFHWNGFSSLYLVQHRRIGDRREEAGKAIAQQLNVRRVNAFGTVIKSAVKLSVLPSRAKRPSLRSETILPSSVSPTAISLVRILAR